VTEKGEKYVGKWDRDIKEGLGRVIESDGNVYEGKIVRGQYQGEGKFVDFETGVIWEGKFESGIMNGKGSEIIPGKYSYVGEFLNGKKTGKGKVEYQDGSSY